MISPYLILGFLTCLVHGNRVKRILGGEYTEIETVPYMLSMRLNNKHICGAVIIGEKWSLTAAHCCIEQTSEGIKKLSMQSGSAELYKGGSLHRVTQVVRNNNYEDNDDDYDICAVQVDPPFEYSIFTMPVKLPDLNVPYNEEFGFVSGWGYTKVILPCCKFTQTYTNFLQYYDQQK